MVRNGSSITAARADQSALPGTAISATITPIKTIPIALVCRACHVFSLFQRLSETRLSVASGSMSTKPEAMTTRLILSSPTF